VILISLSLSWLTAVTSTPLLAKTFLKQKSRESGQAPAADPYAGKFYQLYRKLLIAAIGYRWMTIGIVAGLFVLSLYGFGFIKSQFFPPSTRPQFMVECHFREGIHITETEKRVAEIEDYLKGIEGVTGTASAIGGGHPRFLLTYDVPVDAANQYSLVLVSVEDYEVIDEVSHKIQDDLDERFPDATINVKKFTLGPGNGGKIQMRINGPDGAELRRMAAKAKSIINADEDSKAVRDEWGAKVKTLRPLMAEDRARRLGIDREMTSLALQSTYSGTLAGVYREGIELIPIVARVPQSDRDTVEDMMDATRSKI
jgi:multidrug efflux pump subunit AcrB